MSKNSELSEFGSFVRAKRIEKKLTLGEMAERIGVSSARLSTVEVHGSGFPIEWIKPVADFLELTGSERLELEAIHASKALDSIAMGEPTFLEVLRALNKNRARLGENELRKIRQEIETLAGNLPPEQEQGNAAIP